MFQGGVVDRIILKIASVVYCIAIGLTIWLIIYSPQNGLPNEVLLYMQWWYTQPQTEFQFYLSQASMVAFYLSMVFAVILFFIKKFAGYGFTITTLFWKG